MSKMKSTAFIYVAAVAVFSTMYLALPVSLRAQAPPGPLPAAPPQPPSASASKSQDQQPQMAARTSILGAWKFNRDESDDARKKMQEARKASEGNNSGYGGNRRMGGGWPGGGGGYGGHRGGRGQESGENNERDRMQELLNPANALTLAQKEAKAPEVDLTDDQSRKRAFFTDGRKLKKSQDDIYQEIAAHWDGNRLVTEEKGARGGKMSRSFELSSEGTQLYETLHFSIGRNNTPVTLRYVYDAAPQPK
jgi:hypothetical protein